MLLKLSAATMAATAVLHSILGERRLIMPLLDLNTGITAVPLARQLLRLAWHITSVLMATCAAVVVIPGTPPAALTTIGLSWAVPGFFDAIYTRGRHIGWPFLVVAGVLPLVHVATSD